MSYGLFRVVLIMILDYNNTRQSIYATAVCNINSSQMELRPCIQSARHNIERDTYRVPRLWSNQVKIVNNKPVCIIIRKELNTNQN